MSTYRLQRGRAVAFGSPTTSGARPRFLVAAGSTALRNGPANEKRHLEAREKLLAQGVLAVHGHDQELYVFLVDHEFSSSTAAGDIINDGNFSAPSQWVNEDTGQTLKDDLGGDTGANKVASVPVPLLEFNVGDLYTRDDVADALQLPADKRKGAWLTGYSRWHGQAFIFCTVGSAGRTGHDYPNQWLDRDLVWFGNNDSHADQPKMRGMINGEVPVHVFWRGDARSSFSYAGLSSARDVFGATPVGIRWSFMDPSTTSHTERTPARPPKFYRGPPPYQGRISGVRSDKPTDVYLMVLTGTVEGVLPTLSNGECAIKVGMSNSPRRRLAELNFGFPPNASVRWDLVDTRRFADGASAYEAEGRVLERLRVAKRWTGGEFGVVLSDVLSSLLGD